MGIFSQIFGMIFILLHSPASVLDVQTDAVLNQTIDRQEQTLAAQLANPYPDTGMWHDEDFALAAYWLNTSNTVADTRLIACVTNGLYQSERSINNFHWHAYLLERIYFLFSSRSAFFPGRMSTNTENAVLGMLWSWAAPSCDIRMADPDTVNWVWGSENHHAQAWVSFWGAAHIFKDHPDYQNRTYADGSTPAQMAAAFDEYFKAYAREYATKGLTVETASASYAKYTVNTWYNLVDFAEDPELEQSMSMLLDLYWADWAVEQIDGVRGGSRHRCYPGASSMTRSAGDETAWYHFGLGIAESIHPGVMCAATTFWRPSRATAGLALDVEGRGSYEYITRRLGLKESGTITNFVQDTNSPFYVAGGIYRLNPNGGALLRYTWCTPDFVMGTSQVAPLTENDWTAISSQNRWNGVIFGGNDTARIFTQPDPPVSGSVYNAEWGVQKKGVQILQRLQASNAQGQRVWFDASLTRVETNGWIFAEAPQAYAAVRVVSGGSRWQTDTNFPAQGEWLVLTNAFSPVIIETAPKTNFASFAVFRSSITNNSLTVTTQRVDYSSAFYSTTLTLFSDRSNLPQVDGAALSFTPVRVYDCPYIQGDYNGNTATIHYESNWTVVAMSSAVAVDFGADYTAVTINSTKPATTNTVDADFDGSSDDRAVTIAFGTVFTPPTSTNWITPAGKSGAVIKYGISVANIDSTANPAISLNRIDSSLDRLQASNGAGTSTMRMASAWYWEKTSFLNGAADASALSFFPATNSLSAYFNNSAGVLGSFLVQNSGSWYISDPFSITSDRKSINAATAQWYVFDPAAGTLFWDRNSKGTAVSGATLTNVTALGVYVQNELFDGTSANAALQAFNSFQGAVVAMSSAVAVDFGADYTAVTINSTKPATTNTVDADFDGSSDDRAATIAFGTVFTPPTSTNWITPAGKSGAVIKYGISVANINSTANPSVSLNRIDSTLDRLQASSGAGTSTMRMASAWYWEKTSFLNGASSASPLAFLSAAGSLSVYFYNGTGELGSFLVQNSGSWYISDPFSITSDRKSINAATAQWYVFDPAAGTLFWDRNSKGASVSGAMLTDITAVGIYIQHELFDGTSANAALQAFNSFQATLLH